MTKRERHDWDLAARTVIDFERETVYILPKVACPVAPSHNRQPVTRPRERRAHRSAKATRGNPSSDDDPSEPEPAEPWDTPVGLLAQQLEGDANALADGLAAFGDDLRRYLSLLEEARHDLARQVIAIRARCRDAQGAIS